jgi:hypothetical protein
MSVKYTSAVIFRNYNVFLLTFFGVSHFTTSNLKMEAVGSSEVFMTTSEPTQYYNPKSIIATLVFLSPTS